MKGWLGGRRRARQSDPELEEQGFEDGWETGGWVTTSTGAAALVTTGMRWGAWTMLVVGSVAGVLALLRPAASTAVPRVAADKPAVLQTAGPAGFAEMYVTAFLQTGQGQEAALAAYFPAVRDVAFPSDAEDLQLEQAAAVRVKDISHAYWSVTVAIRTAPEKTTKADAGTGSEDQPGLRYFQVPVREARDGSPVAAALPAEVAAPASGAEAELGYGGAVEAVGSSELVQTLQAVFAAYLSGRGDVAPYLSPGVKVAPVSPAPYTEVKVRRVAEVGGSDPLGERDAPTDGERRQLLVHLDAAAGAGVQRPLTYAVELRARDGRWEISALGAPPSLNTSGNEGVK
ncbi:Conjugative transposon protein TcpC [Streptomyces sp. YIM 130001]|uniref:conjugal transfer protein n=1 Tax=Streptomyces sp. YIM 130001 TaxID=2259644 RepID=UPI000E65B962|nr:conjugal transfer protein [Streptomyces sp. YIM 130001]RII06951.1 Conjugative transposon protein TcpC [Streptomyces sp. YIM 130001]